MVSSSLQRAGVRARTVCSHVSGRLARRPPGEKKESMWDTGRCNAFDTEEQQKGLLRIHRKGGESSQTAERLGG